MKIQALLGRTDDLLKHNFSLRRDSALMIALNCIDEEAFDSTMEQEIDLYSPNTTEEKLLKYLKDFWKE